MTTMNHAPPADPAVPTENAPAKDPEQQWLETIYRKGEKQLTVRAIIAGMLIGGVMCLSNLYVFFKTGWSLGVTLTACILAFAVFELFRAMRLTKSEFTILENNAMGSVASAAGYMTGGGNMAAFGALLMVTTMRPDPLWMMLWFGAIAALGVFAAIPIKRQLINREALAFPTGTATAETLRSMHDAAHAGAPGAEKAVGGGKDKARLLGLAGLVGALLTFLRDAKAAWMPFNIPGAIPLPFAIAGRAAKDWTITLKSELVLVGAGALMSFRTGWSLLLSGLGCYVILAPRLFEEHAIKEVSYKAIVGWTLWPGAAILVASGLTSFVLDYKSVARSFRGLSGLFSRGASAEKREPIAEVECPEWWFPAGFAVLAPVVITLMAFLFKIPLWAGIVAVPLAVIMGFVAARVTGETDVTPTKALGPVTQAVYGVITPGNLTGNIMSANVTGGIGLHAADLLTDLKSGWLLGASPRQQLKGQLFGVIAGALVVVPAFWLIIPDPTVLGSEEWPAPSCLVWAGVSQAFAGGLGGLPPGALRAIGVGFALGLVLALAERFAPKKLLPYIPSPAGIGIALVIPASNAIAMFIGSLIAHVLRKVKPAMAERLTVPVSSGFIAGESLMGIVIALLVVMGLLDK
ncbi:OPT family oligopeptide transporter [Polyangium spumosum]|uniref:OPT family oligopeptide transporter n=1 Tax=Polyangium spumosum TaxID=889282 RepID=A0A6N7PGX1_9BACT|nr:OPT family oligopeptide transporter [Polyangium spumosum]MRG91372.1 OPT family oligopeptide transporter [Polyangium spumosum]